MRLPGFFVFMGPPVRLFQRPCAVRAGLPSPGGLSAVLFCSAFEAGVIPASGTPNGYAQERTGHALGNTYA